jgi:hypothetical protein
MRKFETLSILGSSGAQTRPDHATTEKASREAIDALEKIQMAAQAFNSRQMVAAVNYLRKTGKGSAMRILRDYYAGGYSVPDPRQSRELTVICTCMLLFTPPKEGWLEPWSHAPLVFDTMRYDSSAKKQFPLYPIAVSNGVPFLLTTGYTPAQGPLRARDIPDEGKRFLDLCEHLELISTDLPSTKHDDAAKALIDSAGFKGLFKVAPNASIAIVRGWVLDQAKDDSTASPSSAATMQ